MTNSLAIFLGIIFVGLVAADVIFNSTGSLVFLGKKFLELLSYLAFWR